MKTTQYWMVHKPGTKTNTMHASRASADKEANRLALLEPGEKFVVLEAVAMHKKRPEVEVTDMRKVAHFVFSLEPF